jgi:hypothetical protein
LKRNYVSGDASASSSSSTAAGVLGRRRLAERIVDPPSQNSARASIVLDPRAMHDDQTPRRIRERSASAFLRSEPARMRCRRSLVEHEIGVTR